MKKIVQLVSMLLLINTITYAQNRVSTGETNYYTEFKPEFPGGQSAMKSFLKENVKYPRTARRNKTSGRVFINFIIDKEGNVINAKIMRGIGDGCDEEALRVINAMPQWTPGSQNGEPVNVSMTLPISFHYKRSKRR